MDFGFDQDVLFLLILANAQQLLGYRRCNVTGLCMLTYKNIYSAAAVTEQLTT